MKNRIVIFFILGLSVNGFAQDFRVRFINDEASLRMAEEILITAGLPEESIEDWLLLAMESIETFDRLYTTEGFRYTENLRDFDDLALLNTPNRVNSLQSAFTLVKSFISTGSEWPEWKDYVFELSNLHDRIGLTKEELYLYPALFDVSEAENIEDFLSLREERGMSFSGSEGVFLIRYFQENDGKLELLLAGVAVETENKIRLFSKWGLADPFYMAEFDNWEETGTFVEAVFAEGENGFLLIGEDTIRRMYD